jgi:putative PIN family toxin of toxin-antitoxin system
LQIIPGVYAVLDTSVLVAGLRSNRGASFQILRAIRAGDIRIAVSVALVLEYESVVLRPGLIPGFTAEELGRIVDGLCQLADHQQVFFAWRPFLPDPDDDLVLELAVAASASFVITHNVSDFQGSDSMGVRAITPATTLDFIRP